MLLDTTPRRIGRWLALSLVLHAPLTPVLGLVGLVRLVGNQDDLPTLPPVTEIPLDIIDDDAPPAGKPAETPATPEPEAIAEYERRRGEFRARRDFLVPALQSLGLPVPVQPDGAFYAWADCSQHATSSWDFCFDLMRRAHVAVTPGRDFGRQGSERYIRLSYASAMDRLQIAVARLRTALS